MIYNFDDLKFNILSVQHLRHKKGVFNVEPRQFSALALRIKGTAKFFTDKINVTAFPGDVLFLSSNVEYTVEYTESEMIVIHFSECNYNAEIENSDFKNDIVIKDFFRKILKAWDNHECIYKINALIFELLSAMRETNHQNVSYDAFYMCVKHIEENFSNPDLSIDGICKEYGISPANLRLKFNIAYNLPPKKYLLKLRLAQAVRLLSENLYTIEEIASSSGFNDTKYFCKVIKQTYGMPPSVLSENLIRQ